MTLKRIIHTIVASCRCEFLFIEVSKKISLFKKLLPNHNFYKEGTYRKIRRGDVVYNTDISDYMQWFLFIDAKDISVETSLAFINEDCIVVDIGANVGHFCLKLAKALEKQKTANIEIYAFEPNPWIHDTLLANLKLNPMLKPYIQIHQSAIGAQDDRSEFIFGRRNSGAGRLAQKSAETIMVEVHTLDKLNETLFKDKKISLIKIDVEGFEPEVFLGGWMLIQKHRPVIFFEFSPILYHERGVNAFPILEKLNLLHYQLFYENDHKLLPLSGEFNILNQIDQTNILAIPSKA